MDIHVTCAKFHQKVRVALLSALCSDIEAAFDMESIAPGQAITNHLYKSLDPSEIPTADDSSFVMYGSEKFCFHSMVRKGQTLMQAAPSLVQL